MNGNPDVYVRTYAHFGVDEARDIKARASLKALEGRRIFVLTAPVLTNEAQNALLKVLEEPQGDALFFLVVPSPQALLPTVRSRAQIFTLKNTSSTDSETVVFLSASENERMEMLKPLLEKGSDDKRDLSRIIHFLESLERALGAAKRVDAEALAAVYRARKFLLDKGALIKPLLEQVALLCPRV